MPAVILTQGFAVLYPFRPPIDRIQSGGDRRPCERSRLWR